MKVYNWIIFIILFMVHGCKHEPINCTTVTMSIENRWYMENGGKSVNKEISDKDKKFICERINNFKKGKEIGINDSYGDIDIYFNNRKTQAIFTYKNGVVYRVGIGKYVYDEELTKKIMEIMRIKKRCWGTGCK